MSAPDLTVVLGATTPERAESLSEAVRALERGCEGVSAELVIVGHAVGRIDSTRFTRVRILKCDAAMLTPARWGAGARIADGRVVAFTTDQLRVDAGWARALTGALGGGVVGVGGAIALDPRADIGTAAAHLVRFSAFLPGAHRERHSVDDIAGDNAAYLAAEVAKHPDLLAEGFWEVEFHRRFAAASLRLEMVPDATASLVGPVGTGALARLRYVHAREFGATRVTRHGASRWRIALAAPLVPLVLLARMRRRALADPDTAARFTGLLPRLGLLATAWATGEAVGALTASRAGSAE